MRIESKPSFGRQGWVLDNNIIDLGKFFISNLPFINPFTSECGKPWGKSESLKDYKIDLNLVEGVSEIYSIGNWFGLTFIYLEKLISITSSKEEQTILENVRDYIINFKKWEKDSNKRYVSDYLSEINMKTISKDDHLSKIVSGLYCGELTWNQNIFELIPLSTRLGDSLSKLEEKTLKQCDEYALSLGFNDYSITSIFGSSAKNIPVGEYFYMFNEDEDLMLVKIPKSTSKIPVYSLSGFRTFNVEFFDISKTMQKPIIIPAKDVRDFEITGNQVSSTFSSNNQSAPQMLNTVLSEFLFGSSYTILKGISKQMIDIKSKINDLRVIQLVLNDSSDLRFKGVSVYYDIKRFWGDSKNKFGKNQSDEANKQINSNVSNPQSLVEQLKGLKELLDLGIITQDEFDVKKKKILDL